MQFRNRFTLLFGRLLLVFLFYTLCRVVFYFFNFSYFRELSFFGAARLFFFGLRFDAVAIVISNLLFIALHFLPFQFFYHRVYQAVLRFLFIVVNSVAILFNLIDVEFFRFAGKRAASDAFKVMGFGDDFANTLPKMLRDFWYVLLVFLVLVFLLYRLYNRFRITTTGKQSAFFTHTLAGQLLLALFTFGLCFIGFRGGIQYRPVNITTASRYASGNAVSLVLNTPFTILKTVGKNTLEPRNYFSKKESERLSPVIHHYTGRPPFRNLNVVIIVMEGLGKEYVGSLSGYKTYTPFLDSLITRSCVFPNAFANGKRSIEGIPCIVTGLPAMMPEAFITSAYNGNQVTSIATVLKKKGYRNLFFHGGTNGTMGFENFTRLADYDKYYGRKEYPDDSDFDGSWGIYDEPFLQFAAKKLDETPQPFQATLFTLSAHHPYRIPEKYKGRFDKGTLPIHESMQYADYSLKRFFETAQKSSWFDSTLFVITGDHTALSGHPFYKSNVGMYAVPIVYYRPADYSTDKHLRPGYLFTGQLPATTQQIDILPSILDYLNYDQPFFGFGKSAFGEGGNYAVSFINDIYQIIHFDHVLTMDTSRVLSLYKFSSDSTLSRNLKGTDPGLENLLSLHLKAFIQNYNDAMIHNTMTVK